MARKNAARAAVKTDAPMTDAPEVIADAVVDVVASEAAVAPGWTVIEGGFEPDMISVLPALQADDDGMGEMLPVEGAARETVAHVLADVADAFGLGGQVEAPVVADVALRLPVMLMTEEGARQLAEIFASKVGMPIELLRDGAVIGTVLPGRAGARAAATPCAAKTDGGGNLARAMAHLGGTVTKVERDWSTYDAREVCFGGNASNIKVWKAIADAAEAGDIDALRGFNFAGAHDDTTGNTYTKNNGRYLRAMIAKVESTLADRAATAAFECDMERLIA